MSVPIIGGKIQMKNKQQWVITAAGINKVMNDRVVECVDNRCWSFWARGPFSWGNRSHDAHGESGKDTERLIRSHQMLRVLPWFAALGVFKSVSAVFSYFVWFVFMHCVATGGQHLHHEFTWKQAAKQVHTLSCLSHTYTHTPGLSRPAWLLTDRTSCLWRGSAASRWVCVCVCFSVESSLQNSVDHLQWKRT